MRRLGRLVTIVTLANAPLGVAIAKPKPIKAQFLCGTYVDGKVTAAITGGKRAKITDPVACAIHVDNPDEPSHMGNIHTVRHVVDPSTNKSSKVVSSGKTDDFGGQSDPDKRDFNVILTPGVADENGDIPFKPCEDFDLVATVSDDLGVYFTKTIKVSQTCPKPKPLSAKLTCMYEAQDGTLLRWPGNGDKLKPRLSSGKSFECTIIAKNAPPDTTLIGVVAIHGKSAKQSGKAAETGEGNGTLKVDLGFEPGDDTFTECESFTIDAKLTNTDGAVRWTAKQKVVQDCPD